MADVLPSLEVNPEVRTSKDTLILWHDQLSKIYFYYDCWLDDNTFWCKLIRTFTMLATWSATLTNIITYTWASIIIDAINTVLIVIAGICATLNQSLTLEERNSELQRYCKDIEIMLSEIVLTLSMPDQDGSYEQLTKKHVDNYLKILQSAQNIPNHRYRKYNKLYNDKSLV